MDNFTFTDIMVFLGISQGVFLAITLPIIHQKNGRANSVLALQLGMACLLLVSKMILYKATEIWVIQWFEIAEVLIFLFGPLGYMYLKRLLIQGEGNYRCGIAHYLPAFLYFLYLGYLGLLPSAEFSRLWNLGKFNMVFSIAEGGALCFNIYYWFLCRKVIADYIKNAKDQLSFTQKVIPFLKRILLGIVCILLLWVFSFIGLYFFGYKNPYINYESVWVGIPILIYGIGYYALKQPEIFRVALPKEKEIPVGRARLGEKEIEDLKQRLETLIHEDKVYLKNELTLGELSHRLDSSTNDLSWLLNNVYKSNFYDYINQFRIAAFLQKLQNNEHKQHTLLFLSMEVGFNSKSTFNKAFKAVVQDTPSSYIKKMNA